MLRHVLWLKSCQGRPAHDSSDICAPVMARFSLACFSHCRWLTFGSLDVNVGPTIASSDSSSFAECVRSTMLLMLAVRCRAQQIWHSLLLAPHRVMQEVCAVATRLPSSHCSSVNDCSLLLRCPRLSHARHIRVSPTWSSTSGFDRRLMCEDDVEGNSRQWFSKEIARVLALVSSTWCWILTVPFSADNVLFVIVVPLLRNHGHHWAEYNIVWRS